MAQHNDLGKQGEDIAYRYLIEKGYVILERNWRIGRKELDIVTLDGDILVIVEVKTRATTEEYPAELLSRQKKKNLLTAGEAYLLSRNLQHELRLDLILITGPELNVEHIQEAVNFW
jgi:putative endonuclease